MRRQIQTRKKPGWTIRTLRTNSEFSEESLGNRVCHPRSLRHAAPLKSYQNTIEVQFFSLAIFQIRLEELNYRIYRLL